VIWEIMHAFNSWVSTYIVRQKVSKFVIICLSYGRRRSWPFLLRHCVGIKFYCLCVMYVYISEGCANAGLDCTMWNKNDV